MSRLETLQSRGSPAPGRLGDQIRRLGPWFHNLHLPDGAETAPDHPLGDFPAYKWAALAAHLPADLRGWSALDIGCNAGFYSVELARRGADVLAIDHDPHYLRQARWARRHYRLQERLRLRRMDVFDLAGLRERFDLVLFLGVFYHLRYPMLGLDIAAAKAKRLFVMQSLSLPGADAVPDTHGKGFDDLGEVAAPGWPRMAFIEHDFAGDPSNWWIPDAAASEAMLRSANLDIVARPAEATYVCAPRMSNSEGSRDNGHGHVHKR